MGSGVGFSGVDVGVGVTVGVGVGVDVLVGVTEPGVGSDEGFFTSPCSIDTWRRSISKV